jgi:putative oxidoreductase
MNALNRYDDSVYSLARLIVGLMFACHGGQKILGFPSAYPGGPMYAMDIVAAWIELAGGFLIAFGLFTRVAAFIASGEMAAAYFMAHVAHAPNAIAKFFPIINHGERAVFYCWFFLFVLFYGAGRWSIDALIGKGKAAAATSM